MGLLDDAIREHLELKRRRGADPGEVAREEHEALEPVVPDPSSALDEEPGPTASSALDEEPGPTGQQDTGHPAEVAPAAAAEAPAAAAPEERLPAGDTPLADFSPARQETAELDMQAVLDEDLDAPAGVSPGAPVVAGPVRATPPGEQPQADSLEWEVPERSDHEPAPEDVPGQERLSFD